MDIVIESDKSEKQVLRLLNTLIDTRLRVFEAMSEGVESEGSSEIPKSKKIKPDIMFE